MTGQPILSNCVQASAPGLPHIPSHRDPQAWSSCSQSQPKTQPPTRTILPKGDALPSVLTQVFTFFIAAHGRCWGTGGGFVCSPCLALYLCKVCALFCMQQEVSCVWTVTSHCSSNCRAMEKEVSTVIHAEVWIPHFLW